MDHRQGIRLSARLPVTLIDSRGFQYNTHTANLGRSGFFITMPPGTFSVNQPVELQYLSPDESSKKTRRYCRISHGMVVRVENHGIAVEFDAMTARQRDDVSRLRRWLAEHRRAVSGHSAGAASYEGA